MTDEELARTLWESALDQNGFRDTTADRDAFWNGEDHPEIRAHYVAMAQAARAALTPAVAPLRPGETVHIPDATWAANTLKLECSDTIRLDQGGLWLLVTAFLENDRNTGYDIALDAAGVAQLRETCRRWEAAQGEGQQ